MLWWSLSSPSLSVARALRWAGLLSAAIALVAACGAPAAQSSAASAAPSEQAAPQAPAATQTDPARMRSMWLVHWHEIHVLTVYPMPGPLASTRRSADNPPPAPFGRRHAAFSAVSVHRDSEPWMAEVLASADSLDALLAAFAAREHVEVTEVENDALH